MVLDIPAGEHDLRNTLKNLEAQVDQALAPEIYQVLRTNLERNRIAYFLHNCPGSTLDEYVQRVVEIYRRLHPYLYELQEEKSEAAWVALLARMERWAYSYLIKKGFEYSDATRQLAQDYCADASIKLVHARFPYDTEFDPWVVVLLQNICRKGMRTAVRHDGGLHAQTSMDEEWVENLPDPDGDGSNSIFDFRQDLFQAFKTLEPDERQVLQLYYFQGFKPAEIAARLGKGPSFVYSIKFLALAKLKKVLAQNGYKD
jgi:RNA polymerase sigma factor (sigma-70 family)